MLFPNKTNININACIWISKHIHVCIFERMHAYMHDLVAPIICINLLR